MPNRAFWTLIKQRIVQSGQNLNLSEIICNAVLPIVKCDEDKNKKIKIAIEWIKQIKDYFNTQWCNS